LFMFPSRLRTWLCVIRLICFVVLLGTGQSAESTMLDAFFHSLFPSVFVGQKSKIKIPSL
jgi:hypothetical protein